MAHSTLHLLDNWRDVIVKVHGKLKPGGVFVTSTACLGDNMAHYRFIAPILRLFGLTLQILTIKELEQSLTNAGFKIDHKWQPGGGDSVFIVAKKIN